jgi:hypothetical protein
MQYRMPGNNTKNTDNGPNHYIPEQYSPPEEQSAFWPKVRQHKKADQPNNQSNHLANCNPCYQRWILKHGLSPDFTSMSCKIHQRHMPVLCEINDSQLLFMAM